MRRLNRKRLSVLRSKFNSLGGDCMATGAEESQIIKGEIPSEQRPMSNDESRRTKHLRVRPETPSSPSNHLVEGNFHNHGVSAARFVSDALNGP